ncbi:hypothetical protein [Polymorphospora sp. A560]
MAAQIPDRRRFVRQLVRHGGRGFAEEYGLPVLNNPANLYQLLSLAQILRGSADHRRATAAARALRDRGWNTAARMAASPDGERAAVLRAYDQRAAGTLARRLGATAAALAERYGGDPRRLRTAARRDPAAERALLRELPGVDDGVIDLFFRDVQVLWPEIGPFADRNALTAARRLGLGSSAQDLADLTGRRESEKLAWLVGALARIELDGSYAQARQLATA